MPVGTIKSGKTTLVHQVLPGMLAAAHASGWPATRPRPVIFRDTFVLGSDAEPGARQLLTNLCIFAQRIGVPCTWFTDGCALDSLRSCIATFAISIQAAGGELWLLLDELQVPLLASKPEAAKSFTNQFKQLLTDLCMVGCVVATGGSMFTLLNAFRNAHAYSYLLWDAIRFVQLGSTPSAAALTDMLAAMVPVFMRYWTDAAKTAGVTPAMVVAALQPDVTASWTSPRPALLAYALWQMQHSTGTAPDIVAAGVDAAMTCVRYESQHDAIRALQEPPVSERSALLAVAAGKYTISQLAAIGKGKRPDDEPAPHRMSEKLAALIAYMREDGLDQSAVRLQSPYGALVQRWVAKTGRLAVASLADSTIDLDVSTRTNLVFLDQRQSMVNESLRRAAGAALLASLASDGIGHSTGKGRFSEPRTPAEFQAIPVLWCFHTSLLEERKLMKPTADPLPLTQALRRGGADFASIIEWEVLLAFRNLTAYSYQHDPVELVHGGWTAAIVVDAVQAAVKVLARPSSGCFKLRDGLLDDRSAATKRAVTGSFKASDDEEEEDSDSEEDDISDDSWW